MGGGGINTSATKLEALNIQSSTAGAVIPWLRGQHRIPGNLLWYGDFKASAHTQQQGGKGGGGGTSTSYTYSASLVMGLCHGIIASIVKVWKGKGTSSAAALGLSVQTGTVGQPMWSGLAGRGAQSLNYSGLATVSALNYQLGDSASVENHSFEVRHSSAGAVDASTPDVDPKVATYELLTHAHQGAAFPAALIGDWSDWSDYCVANRLLISPLLTTQTSARDALQTMADLTNTGIVWSDGKLKMRPYGDAEVTAYGRTFTPDTTPVYELDDNCYIRQGDDAPVKRSLKSPADRKNFIKVQYRDRANGYNPAVVDAKDLTDISANGARPLDPIQADWICTSEVARFVAEIRKQRELLVVGEYSFRLPWHYALIECMDLLTLSDSVLMLDGVPVRVKQIVEESDEELSFTCEDFPAGVASAPLYPSQGMTGFALNANVAPGDAMAPLVFELPGALTTTGLELAIATGSTDPNWGGCQVWVSYDGTTYRQLTELRTTSRYGITQLDTGGTLHIFTNAGQQLLSGSAADAAALATLIYVAPSGSNPGEFMSYQTATLTAPNAYTLGGLVRGAYDTLQVEHAGGTPWVRVDDAVARSGPLDQDLIGKTVHIKLCSFNVFGGGVQSLAEVAATTYTIRGQRRPSAADMLNSNVGAGNMLWGLASGPWSAGPGDADHICYIKTEATNPHGLVEGELISVSADLWQDASSAGAGHVAALMLWTQDASGVWKRSTAAWSGRLTATRASGSLTLPAAADMVRVGVGLFHPNGAGTRVGVVHADRLQVERGPATLYKAAGAPGATVGAPPGTLVGETPAEDVESVEGATAKAALAALTALWDGVSGRPYDYNQNAAPSGTITDGSTWRVPATGRVYIYLGGWTPVVGTGSVDTGELADNAATDVLTTSASDVDIFDDSGTSVVTMSLTYYADSDADVLVSASGAIDQVCSLAQWSTFAGIISSGEGAFVPSASNARARNVSSADAFALGSLSITRRYFQAAGTTVVYGLVGNSGGFPRTGPQAGCACYFRNQELRLEGVKR
jgi:Putative phage tail protein